MIDLALKRFKDSERAENEILFFHTPFCGTCQIGERMLEVIEASNLQPSVTYYSCRVSEWQPLVHEWQIESVPALVFLKNGIVKDIQYAFVSIPHLCQLIDKFVMDR